jgi:undecaprenyl-diphosphatase
MGIVNAIILGLVQGLTEFLPVSSSGHLIFVPYLFGWADQGLTFDLVVHVGTLLAVIWYFRKRLVTTVRTAFLPKELGQKERRFLYLVVLSIIPAGLIGFFLGDTIETVFRSPTVVAWNLIIWGIVLYVAERYRMKKTAQGIKPTESYEVNKHQVSAMAIAQAVALVPGTSRSGITMTAGMFAGLSKQAAAEFSFLMSIPVIGLSAVVKLFDLLSGGVSSAPTSILVVGFLTSFISGVFAISFLMKLISRWTFLPFTIYRVAIGILILVFLV